MKDLQLEPLQPEGTTGTKMNQNGVMERQTAPVIWIFLKLAFDSGKIIALRVCESPLKSLLNETGKRMGKGQPAKFVQLKPFQVVSSGEPTIQAPRSRLCTCTV